MSDFIAIAARVAPLAVPVILGVVVARRDLLTDLDRSIAALNVFALYIGFPALVYAGLVGSRLSLPTEIGFWAAIPLSQLLVVLAAVALAPRDAPHHRGTLALVGLFGNIAYLGLPVSIAVFGESIAGLAAVAVSIHVTIAVSLGPALLARWSGGAAPGLRLVLRQPLFWAPFAGLLTRVGPEPFTNVALAVTQPLGAAAAPVALFMLGLYLFHRRDALRKPLPRYIFLCLVASPAITAAVVLGLRATGMLASAELAGIAILLSGMPAAVATFSIAHDVGSGTDEVAAAVVQSTLWAMLSLTPLAWGVVALVEHW